MNDNKIIIINNNNDKHIKENFICNFEYKYV